MIRLRRKCLNLPLVGLLAVGLSLGLAACGGDDEEPAPADTQAETEKTERPESETETSESETREAEPPTEEAPTETEPPASPEDQPGGAGDEEPARSLALFIGEDGRITPRVIRVPPFISIRIELRSADGRPYGLEFRGARVRVSGPLSSVSSTIDGLRPGDRLVGTASGAPGTVRIEANAEPGP